MIKILKTGVKPKHTKIIYTTTCDICGCKFEFENEDIKSQEKRPNGNIFIDCPTCYFELKRTYNELNPRIIEVKENG